MQIMIRRAERRPWRSRTLRHAVGLAAGLALVAAGAGWAGTGGWSFRLEGLLTEVNGLQPTVAELRTTVFEGDRVTTQELESLAVDYGSPLSLRGRVERLQGRWGWGVGFGRLSTDGTLARGPLNTDLSQGFALDITSEIFGAVTAPGLGQPGLSFSSRNELGLSVLDLYGIRRLGGRPDSAAGVTVGLRLAEVSDSRQEFWNLPEIVSVDHRARAATGTLVGPQVGLLGATRHGAHRFEVALTQSVLTGDARLDLDQLRAVPSLGAMDRLALRESRSVTIPNTELRLGWLIRVSAELSLGVSAFASAWWEAPAAPVADALVASPIRLSDDTLVLSGLLLTVAWE